VTNPTTVLHTVPPTEQLSQLTYRRDELLRAAQRNRVTAQQRANELMEWKAKGEIDEDYSIEDDHRIASLEAGAEQWDAEAAREQDKIDQLSAQIGQIARPLRGPVRGKRQKGEE
jgi:hypothetical protein